MSKEETLEQRQARLGCTCVLRGKTWLELRAMGTGCRRTHVCPVLDKYRQAVMKTVTAEQRAADDLRLAKELGIGRGVGL